MSHLTVSGGFDDLQAPRVRELADLAKRGKVHLLLWSDELFRQIEKHDPKFPLAERQYFLESIHYVHQVSVINARGETPPFMEQPATPPISGRKKVIVTGCYDWLHTGHVRFFEEVSAYGDVYAVVGHDANIELLKGKGHPQYPEEERRFLVGSLRFVKEAMISTGNGWMDAEPEIARVKPDVYAVNEDGDKPEKREFCQKHGVEYLVLKRLPKPGLTRRSSTDLRGF